MDKYEKRALLTEGSYWLWVMGKQPAPSTREFCDWMLWSVLCGH